MKRTGFTDEQIVGIFAEREVGASLPACSSVIPGDHPHGPRRHSASRPLKRIATEKGRLDRQHIEPSHVPLGINARQKRKVILLCHATTCEAQKFNERFESIRTRPFLDHGRLLINRQNK